MSTPEGQWTPSADDAAAPPNPDMNPETASWNQPLLPETLPAARAQELAANASPELVQAFRMNAEALHRLQDMQQQLVGAVERSNRSEMMIQSTQTLNETFRNLTQVQRSLLDRVEAAPQRSSSRMVPLMLLGLLIVLVGGVAVIVESIRQNEGANAAARVDQAQVAEQISESLARGRQEGMTQRTAEVERLQAALAAADERIVEHQTALDDAARERSELERGNQALEFTNRELAKEVTSGRQAEFAKRALEKEIERMKLEYAATDSVIESHKAAVERQRRLNLDLRKRIAAYGLGLPDDPDYDPAHDPNAPIDSTPSMQPIRPPNVPNVKLPARTPEQVPVAAKGPTSFDKPPLGTSPSDKPWGNAGAVPPPPVVRRASGSASGGAPDSASVGRPPTTPPPPAVGRRGMRGSADVTELPARLPSLPGQPPLVRVDDRVDRRPVVTKRVRQTLNTLLERSRDSSGMLYQITGLQGVTANRLAGVRLIRHDDARGVPEIITAQDVRVVVDRKAQNVTLFLRGGERVGKATRERIPPQGARVTVARGAAIQPWLRSGLRMVESR